MKTNISYFKKTAHYAVLTAFMGALISGPATAQIDEIIVTSQKKAAGISVQDVGVAITALDADKISDSFSVDLRDLARFAPNAELDTSATFVGYPNFYIRGIGVNGSTRTADPAVGIFLNGVYLGYSPASLLDTFDLEVVEILRGPQGTLLGRNVTGGAINARTKRPGDEFKVEGKITLGDYNQTDVMVGVDMPLSDKTKVRLSVLTQNRDGYWEDTNSGTVDTSIFAPGYPTTTEVNANGAAITGGVPNATGTKPDIDTQTIRATLMTELGENTDLTLIGEYYTSSNGPANSKNITHSAGRQAQTVYGFTPPAGDYAIDHNLHSQSEVELWSLTGELTHDLGHGLVTAVASRRELVDFNTSTDFDGTPFTLFHFPDNRENQEQDSIELRYASTFSEKFDFTAGLYFFDQSYYVGERRQILQVVNQAGVTELDHEIQAIFGQLTYNVNDQVSVVAGLRRTQEEKAVKFSPPGTCALDFSSCTTVINKDGEFENTTPHLALNYKPNEDSLYYISYTEGFKSGAFNQRAQSAAFIGPADEESVSSIEVGMKSIMNDGKFLFNAAVFMVDYEDIQVNVNEDIDILVNGVVQTASGQVLKNAAKAEISGVELEAIAYLSDNLKLNGAFGYVDAEYKEFQGIPNASSLKFARVPEFTYNIGVEYELPVKTGLVTFRGDYSYKDDYFTDLNNDPEIMQDGFGLVDLSVSYDNEEKGYRVSLYGRNVTDEDYFEFAANVGNIDTVVWGGAPQRFGLELAFGL
ncbi:MAG: TonB-dependent receptor [Parvibaculales bacterium]